MTMTTAYDHSDSKGSAGLIGSSLNLLSGIFTSVAVARERQMRHRVDSLLEDRDREMLIALGHQRPVRPKAPRGRFPV